MHEIRCLVACGAVFAICGAAEAQQLHATPPAESADRPGRVGRIGIAVIGPATLPADLRIRLEDAAAAGLRASGADVVSPVELSRARAGALLGTCADTLCEQRLAQVTDTRYWLRGTCQVDTSTYRLHLELVDARSGAVLVARDDTCDICTEADAAETANVAASALKAALGRVPHSASPKRTPAASTGPVAVIPLGRAAAIPPEKNGGPPADLALPSRKTPQDDNGGGRPLWRRLLPWGAFAAAATAAAAGTYYVAINNQGFQCGGEPEENCHVYNDTLWRWGVPWLAVGAACATVGVLLLTGKGGDVPSARSQPPAPGGKAAPQSTVGLGISFGAVNAHGTF